MNNPLFYALFMLATGIGTPIMAALNGHLGQKLNNTSLATTILFFVCFSLSTLLLLALEGVPKTLFDKSIPFYYYLGGVFIVFYIFGITWVAPKFGVGNAIAFVLLGQMISMTIIDHFGLLGAQLHMLSLQRSVGILMMTIGVFLVAKY